MKTVLFDLDGTLLPMEQDIFVKAYLSGLATKLVPHGYDPKTLSTAIWAGTKSMVANDGTITNEEAFWETFSTFFVGEVRKDEPLFDHFYRNEFQFVALSCGHEPRAAKIITYLKEKGCRMVLATNPIFPAVATQSRMKWAGLDESDFELITTYENSRHCKPNIEYYQDILTVIGEVAENCIMVGNDVTEDMVARNLGIEVFLLTDCIINKEDKDISQYPHGSFPELMAFLEKST